MSAETENQNIPAESAGTIRVHESVLAAIVRKAVSSVPEVLRLSGSSFIDNIAEMVNSRKSFDRSMVIEVNDDQVSVEVRIIVRYGAFIPSVASAVQKVIAMDIPRLSGMKAGKINVVVMDVDEESSAALEEVED